MILIVDDERENHSLLEQAYEGAGVIHHAYSAQVAIHMLEKHDPFDVVTLDFDLTPDRVYGPSGLCVAKHIISMARARRPLRVIVHTPNRLHARQLVTVLVRGRSPVSWNRLEKT